MGYCATQRDEEFFIPADRKAECVQAIKGLAGLRRQFGFSWVDDDFVEKNTFCEIMEAWRWEVSLSKDGDAIGICFQGEKLGDDDVLFGAIAPFVRAGSYIEMHGEDGAIWRWVFDGKECVEKVAKITF
jgi:hypothetical protein